MEQEKENIITKIKKKKRYVFSKTFVTVLFMFIATDVFLWYFSTPVLRKFIQKVVYDESKGMYSVDFDRIYVELTTITIKIEGFKLIPNLEVFEKRKRNKEINTGLYEISFDKLVFSRLKLFKLYNKKEFIFKSIIIDRPHIKLMGLPDKELNKNEKYDAVHKDLYTVISPYLNAVEADIIVLNQGRFDFFLKHTDSQEKTGVERITVNLHNFRLDVLNHESKEKLFYSKNFDIDIDNYNLLLNDSIHRVYAKLVHISSQTGIIRLEDIGIKPEPEKINKNDISIYDISSPLGLVTGIKFNKAWFDKQIFIDSFFFDRCRINIVSGTPKKKDNSESNKSKPKNNVKQEKKDFKNIYSLLKGKVEAISVNKFIIEGAGFEFKEDISDKIPNYKIDSLSIRLENFKLDSSAHLRKDKILFSDEIELDVRNYSMKLKDGSHVLKAGAFIISTKDKHIKASNVQLNPIESSATRGSSVFNFNIDSLQILNADFKKTYNTGILKLDKILLSGADFKITNTYDSKKKRKKISVIYDLISPYLNTLKINEIETKNSSFTMNKIRDNENIAFYKGDVSFLLKEFELDKETAKLSDRVFYAKGFSFLLENYSMKSEKDFHKLEIQSLNISSFDSIIEIYNFNYAPENPFVTLETLKKYRKNQVKTIRIEKFKICDIDIANAVFEKKFYADSVVLINPDINLKTFQGIVFPELDTLETEDIFEVASNDIFKAADSLNSKKIDTISDKIKQKETLTMQNYKDIIAKMLLNKLNIVNINHLNVERGKLNISKFDTSFVKKSSLSGNISVAFTGFEIHSDSTDLNKNFLFSQKIRLNISDFSTLLKDSVHILKISGIDYNNSDSTINAKYIRISPDQTQKKKLNSEAIVYIPDIFLRGVNPEQFVMTKQIYVSEVNISNPVISIELQKDVPKKKRKNISKQDFDIVLPKAIKSLNVRKLSLEGGIFELSALEKGVTRALLKSDFTGKIDDVSIDSANIATIKKNLKISGAELKLADFEAQTPGKIYNISSDTILYSQKFQTVEFQNLKYTFDTAINIKDTLFVNGKSSTLEFAAPYTKAYGVNLLDITKNRILSLEKISFQNPCIISTLYFKSKTKTSFTEIENRIGQAMIKNFDIVDLGKIHFLDAQIINRNNIENQAKELAFSDISGRITNFHIDSLTQMNEKILFSEDISFRMKDYRTVLPSDLYVLHTNELGISTSKQKIYADYFSLMPKYSQSEFEKKSEKPKSMMFLEGKYLAINNLDLRKFFETGNINADEISTEALKIHLFSNKQLPADTLAKQPVSPIAAFLKLKQNIDIDSVTLKNSYFSYEQNSTKSNKTGIMTIENINAKITNLTNDSNSIKNKKYIGMVLSGNLMGEGKLKATFRFPMENPTEYRFVGTIDTTDLRVFNPILENTAFMKIEDGRANKIRFVIAGNDTIAQGTMRFNYNNLEISFKDTANTRKGLTSMLANTILASDNPKRKFGKLREGDIFQQAVKNKPVFHLWTQALLSGTFSSLGFKTKQMKQSYKVKKQLDKILKKEERRKFKKDKKLEKEMEKEIENLNESEEKK